MSEDEMKFWGEVREALLALVDIIERRMKMPKRTSDIRREYKQALREARMQQPIP